MLIPLYLFDGIPESRFITLFKKTVIGYLKLNSGRSQTELKQNDAVEIERIYPLKEFHGREVVGMLFQKAMQVAREKKSAYIIRLGVWEQNE